MIWRSGKVAPKRPISRTLRAITSRQMDTQLIELVSPSADTSATFGSEDTPFLPTLAVAGRPSFEGA